ncbi:TonB-dependent receptor [bacterium]|nr:TonB-dependent receptor [bacterium]
MLKSGSRLALATLAVLLVMCVSALAQLNTSKVEGVVRDKETGQPLAGAQVMIEGTRLGNVTNADGYYFILNIPPGRRSITFTYTGYQKTTISNQLILAGQTVTVNATLSSSVVELGGITIEGESEVLVPRDNTVSKQRITAASISETPTSSLDQLMLLEAGVQTGGPGAMARGMRIRGGRLGNEVMVVDGVAVRNYTADPFKEGLGWAWNQEFAALSEDVSPLDISTQAVEQVDIITGGFQAEYGNAQSGIINVVTKEGGADWVGNTRFTTDEVNPRTADYGYNQLTASLGGPIPGVKNLYIQGSGEIQGQADRNPTHADEGFRGVNQRFVDILNESVRNDPILGSQEPAYTLDMLKRGTEFYASKTGGNASLFTPGNPVRVSDNWGDRTLTSSKLTYYPIKGVKLLGSYNFSRIQNSFPSQYAGYGSYFMNGIATEKELPHRDWSTANGDWKDADGLWTCYVPMAYARRTRTSNLLAGFDWDFLQSSQRNASLQFRFTRMRTQDINSSSLKDNYFRSDHTTFGGWSMHDIPFEVETFPGRNFPVDGSAEAFLYYPDGSSGRWMTTWYFNTPFALATSETFYYLSYFYSREFQNNYKADLDFQLNRQNRAKMGIQFSDFSNNKYQTNPMSQQRNLDNEFNYSPNVMGLYLQNRTDLGDFVLNYGVRYDRFNPVNNWGFRNGDDYGDFFKTRVIDEWSPRFDVGFPVTDKAQLRFSYGVFTQLPSFAYIFSGSNPGGLGYSRTDAFEAGLSYLIGENIVLDVVSYYRDILGDVSTKTFFRDFYAAHEGVHYRYNTTGYTNRDNGNIKGMDLTLRKRFANNFAFDAIYTLQFSRTTGSSYGSTSEWGSFLDPATGEAYSPPDEIRPIDGDVTHKATFNLNYLFPRDFRSGTLAGNILKDFRIYSVLTLMSGPPAFDLVRSGGGTSSRNNADDVTWLTRRNGRPIGGVNYFRTRWDYNLDLRLSKSLSLTGKKRFNVFVEVFNALNNKLHTPYPSGYGYTSSYYRPNGGEEMVWSESLNNLQKGWFKNDYNQDGVLSLEEQAKGVIANAAMNEIMDKTQWGSARQIRSGVEFSF